MTLLVLVVLLLAMPLGAQEDCASPEVTAQLSQGSFVGTAGATRADGTDVVVSFAVEEVFSGPLTSGVLVNVRLPAGDWRDRTGRIGVLVNRRDGEWVSGACRLLEPDVLAEVAPTSISPESLGENERETLTEPPLWIFFGIFGGGIGVALLLQHRRDRSRTGG